MIWLFLFSPLNKDIIGLMYQWIIFCVLAIPVCNINKSDFAFGTAAQMVSYLQGIGINKSSLLTFSLNGSHESCQIKRCITIPGTMLTTVSFVCSKHLVQNAKSNFETDSVSNSTSIIKSAVTKGTLRNLLNACLTSLQQRTDKFGICYNNSKTQLYLKLK
jgi:hypothetical protein